ncbi:MAG: methyl-accepting chemotaxis protein [Myxococcota bacterium]
MPAPVVIAVLVSLTLGVALWLHYRHARAEAVRETKERLLATQFEPRRQAVERLFTLTYQSVRTISLLPSVRGISGGNRKDEREDVVQSRRFPLEGDRTVQQLFNNLASNVQVSEVYLVLDGFAPERGEVPFRMYDAVIVAPEAQHTEGQPASAHGDDEPEELEAEEYAHYPQQLRALAARRPTLDGATLDDIPAVASPVMRTCDNAQYESKRSGDPHDADGLLYSAPIYDARGAFHGLVSAVVRTNVLEATLLGIPRLIITEEDRQQAAAARFSLPAEPGNFVLGNPARDTWVGDRRDASFLETAKAFARAPAGEELHLATLTVKDESPWVLVYRYEPGAIAAVEREALVRFLLELAALVVFAAALILGPIGIHLKRTRVLEVESRIAEIAAGGGDLTRRLEIQRRDEVGALGRSFDALLERVHALVVDIKVAARGVEVGAQELSRGNESVSHLLQQQATSTEELSSNITELTRAAKRDATEAAEVSAQALESSRLAEESGALVKRSSEAMAAVAESSQRIATIVEVVEEIAFQTNLLALNAGVEAARAGEHGKSFGVVADEVRALAERTRQATVEIRQLVHESAERTTEMQGVISSSSAQLTTIAQTVRDVSARITQLAQRSTSQAAQITALTEAVARIDSGTQTNAATAEESSSVATSLKQQADRLSSLVGQFKVREGAGWKS